jgi:hypothetical protein
MKESFPALTHLDLTWDLKISPPPFLLGLGRICPTSRLKYVSFPERPTFLLSARNLVTLKLEKISENVYISLEAMIGCLAVLTRLTTLCDKTSLPEQRTRGIRIP